MGAVHGRVVQHGAHVRGAVFNPVSAGVVGLLAQSMPEGINRENAEVAGELVDVTNGTPTSGRHEKAGKKNERRPGSLVDIVEPKAT